MRQINETRDIYELIDEITLGFSDENDDDDYGDENDDDDEYRDDEDQDEEWEESDEEDDERY
jgi:hypothetical protein